MISFLSIYQNLLHHHNLKLFLHFCLAFQELLGLAHLKKLYSEYSHPPHPLSAAGNFSEENLWVPSFLRLFTNNICWSGSTQNLHFRVSPPRLREACLRQNGWIFGKFSNGLWHPRPFFREKCCNFFRNSWRPALNLQRNFSDRKWPPFYFEVFPEIHDQKCSF